MGQFSYFGNLKIFYKIPDTKSPLESKMFGLLYENYSLRIQLALYPVKKMTDESTGTLIIEQGFTLRYEGFTPELALIMKFLIADIKDAQRVKF
jgi:hypothetical protein